MVVLSPEVAKNKADDKDTERTMSPVRTLFEVIVRRRY
jgi:hypothetical protein